MRGGSIPARLVYNEKTNMRAKIERLLEEAKRQYSRDKYVRVAHEVLDAANDVRHFSFQAVNAYDGDEQALRTYPDDLRKAENGIVVVNSYARQLGIEPIMPEPDDTLAGLFNLCCEYKYDVCAYLLEKGLGIDPDSPNGGLEA